MTHPENPVHANPSPSPQAPARVEITAADLPLHCPMPGSPLWNAHPRVFLPIGEAPLEADGTRHMRCPYCGTEYVLRET